MLVSEVLRRKGAEVATIHSVDTVEQAVKRLNDHRIGALVVTDRWGRLIGIFSERDVIRALAHYGPEALGYEVHELMTDDVTTCALGDRIDTVMGVMSAHRIRHLPVMEAERLVGIISIGDLVKFRLDEKEQEANVLRDITRAHV